MACVVATGAALQPHGSCWELCVLGLSCPSLAVLKLKYEHMEQEGAAAVGDRGPKVCWSRSSPGVAVLPNADPSIRY